MTNSEFRNLVAKSSNCSKCGSLTLNFHYATEAGPKKKQGLTTIYEYVKRERNAWKRFNKNLPNILTKSYEHFDSLLSQIENFALNHLNKDERSFQNNWNSVASTSNKKKNLYPAKSSEAEFIIELYEKYPNAVSGAHSFFITRGNQRMNLSNISHDEFIGYLLAYEFDLQDETDLHQRRNNEKISLGGIRADYEKFISEAESHVQELTKKTYEDYSDYQKRLDELEKKKEALFNKWYNKTRDDFNSFYEASKLNASNLRETYREGLRFAGPVRYWTRRALQLKKEGAYWIKWLLWSSALVTTSLFLLLILIPEGMTASLFSGDPVAIKWAVIYVTFVSFMVYAVRTFARLTFSSYHLARDAEEREQLTHVYLALKKDGNVEEKDRILVLQSLFSRAETGLLKDDSSPTLPGNSILNKINGSN